ncbi:hypothetical protein [Paenibacillus sp. Leaf72]|uniref:hypothetical protein n=1 Tax=Paenibacillus sp. Leaf72 TaxID=1736234 RepID=UPI0006F92F58|nr:hypothetical protein [Paenibacillus sp. Leaf72]KQO12442.1 hypothetical protein ASF12_30990 [Paenibacillus sp. Leaf72]
MFNRKLDNPALNRTLLTGEDCVTQDSIDLTNCDKEPIHIPGYIQPHGVLLAARMDAPNEIVQSSRLRRFRIANWQHLTHLT